MCKGPSELLQELNAKALHAKCSLHPFSYYWEERELRGKGLLFIHTQCNTCLLSALQSCLCVPNDVPEEIILKDTTRHVTGSI